MRRRMGGELDTRGRGQTRRTRTVRRRRRLGLSFCVFLTVSALGDPTHGPTDRPTDRRRLSLKIAPVRRG